MQSGKAGADGTVRATIKTLNRSIMDARRRTDRYIRLFHRARADEIKMHWFDLAVVSDEQAADASLKLRDVLEQHRSTRV